MYGPPGTGKTMMARACAGQTKATFLKLAGSNLVQMYIGDGPKMVRDAFALAKEKAPTIIFIDEIDAIGTKRFDNDKSGDREVQRTMLELLNHLDGYTICELVFHPMTTLKSSAQRIDLTSWTPPLCVQADLIGKSSSPCQLKMREDRSLRSTPER
jgi:AAA+ superfamily predicted ATPase